MRLKICALSVPCEDLETYVGINNSNMESAKIAFFDAQGSLKLANPMTDHVSPFYTISFNHFLNKISYFLRFPFFKHSADTNMWNYFTGEILSTPFKRYFLAKERHLNASEACGTVPLYFSI